MAASRTQEPRGPERDAPASAEEALARARRHARCALSEAVAAAHALLDAAALATNGAPARSTRALAPIARLLDGVEQGLAPDSGAASAPLLNAFAEALDAEIARWEARSRDDAEARAVLRAFLGVRELLWELGLRRRDAAPESGGAARAPGAVASPRAVRRRPRVERVPVEG
jgi:hypothetical protein